MFLVMFVFQDVLKRFECIPRDHIHFCWRMLQKITFRFIFVCVINFYARAFEQMYFCRFFDLDGILPCWRMS